MKVEKVGQGTVEKNKRWWVLIIFILTAILIVVGIYLPSHLSYRERKKYNKSIEYAHIVQASLLEYPKKASSNCYPKKIEKYYELREIVSQHKSSFPKNFEDSGFKSFTYTLKDCKEFHLVIEIDDESPYRKKNVIITPTGFKAVR